MKRLAGLLVVVLCLSASTVCAARSSKEQKMRQKAHEIGLMGQMEQANELMGGKGDLSKEGDTWNTSSLMLGLIWGAIGSGYFIYGKKQGRAVFLLCGVVLCVFPMVITDVTTGTVVGLLLTFAPFKIDL
ncbi:MAG TPA: hypothetical protein PKO06_04780 [Candidatus Ozemobacteraceae bacterium]|nr:hypothetical protein [Candidatus Ozemobacteraceae bacterium]